MSTLKFENTQRVIGRWPSSSQTNSIEWVSADRTVDSVSIQNFYLEIREKTCSVTSGSSQQRQPSTLAGMETNNDVWDQLVAICQEVCIPEDVLKILADLKERIQKIAKERNHRVEQTTIFRHNYLKLFSAGSNQILVYLSQFKHRPLHMTQEEVEKLFTGSQLKPLQAKELEGGEMEAGYPFVDEETGIVFSVVTHQDHQAEVFACQLARQLFRFDPRAKTLITLVHYWARENRVTLSETKSYAMSIPDPAALEWICLFFLSREKLIPTLQDLENDSDKTRGSRVLIGERRLLTIPFPNWDQLISEWRAEHVGEVAPPGTNEYVLQVLKLIHDFFSFCSRKDLKGKVLNPVNGDIIPLIAAIEEGLITEWISADKCINSRSFEAMRNKPLELEAELKGDVILLQPYLNRQFQISQEKFENRMIPLMQASAKRLGAYLKQVQEHGEILWVNLKPLFQSTRVEVLEMPITYPAQDPTEDRCFSISSSSKEIGLVQQQQSKCKDQTPRLDKAQPVPQLSSQIPVSKFKEERLEDDEMATDEKPSARHNFEIEVQDVPNILPSSFLLEAMSEAVSVSDQEWQRLTDLRKMLSGFFGLRGFPDSQLVLFRNNYLKLKFGSSDVIPIFLFLDHDGLYSIRDGRRTVVSLEGEAHQHFIGDVKNRTQYSEESKVFMQAAIQISPQVIGTQQHIPLFSFDQMEMLIANTSFLPEVQACRLLQYFCTLDARVKPLITVIFYWAKLNNIRLEKRIQVDLDDPSTFTVEVGLASDQSLLEWLAIFFLCQHKILPSPKEICDRCTGKGRDATLIFEGIDIGFNSDPDYAQEMSDRFGEPSDGEQHAETIFRLAGDFFQFWCQFGIRAAHQPMIIDLKNGNCFEKNLILENLKNTPSLNREYEITVQDLKILDSKQTVRQNFYSTEELVTVLHPLHIKYGFTFCSKSFVESVCPKMGLTCQELRKRFGGRFEE